MLDFIKSGVGHSGKFENHLLTNKVVSLRSDLNHITGEIDEYPKKGKLENLVIRINPVISTISGSLHKFDNISTKGEDHNHDDFNYCQLAVLIPSLIEKLNIANDTSLSYLEMGFNLRVDVDPQRIIDDKLLMCWYKSHNRDEKFKGNGDFKEFAMTDYTLKIYNKSKQFKLSDNILRIELKIKSKRFLQKLGIYKLEDLLDKQLLTEVFNALWSYFERALVVDEFYNKEIPQIDLEKLIKYTNPHYWQEMRNTKSFKVQSRFKKDFNRLLNKYNLNKTKIELQEKLKAKFLMLLNEECNAQEAA